MENKNLADEYKGFNFGRLFLGIIILAIGLFFLGRSAGIIPENYSINLFQLWPVLIIYFGLSMIDSHGWFGTFIGIICTIIILIIIGVSLFMGNFIGSGLSKEVRIVPITVARDINAVSGVINITSSAGNIAVSGDANELVTGNLKTNFMDIKEKSSINNGVQTVDLETTGMGSWNWSRGMGRFTNDLDLKMSSDFPLTVSINSGASVIKADFSEIMLNQANIKTGASSMDITLGDKLNESIININAGMSSVKIHIPQSVGVKLAVDGGLNSTKTDKFNKIDDKNFESENYKNSDKKIIIKTELGMSNLEIIWQ